MNPKPQRIRLSRKAGFNLQHESKMLNGLSAVNCARPSQFGNPYTIGKSASMFAQSVEVPDVATAVRLFEKYAALKIQSNPDWAKELRGKNLACWCPLGQPCHCDILLKIANE